MIQVNSNIINQITQLNIQQVQQSQNTIITYKHKTKLKLYQTSITQNQIQRSKTRSTKII